MTSCSSFVAFIFNHDTHFIKRYTCNFHDYTNTWEIRSAIWSAYSSGISAKFEILTYENYKPFAGSSINK